MDNAPGLLTANLMHFARLLRGAGINVPPARVADAVEACPHIDLTQKTEVFATLRALFTSAHDQADLFRIAFETYWRDRREEPSLNSLLDDSGSEPDDGDALPNRLADSLAGEQKTPPMEDDAAPETLSASYSAAARLKQMDFATMTSTELSDARRIIRQLRLPIEDVPTRRFTPSGHGERIDLRATLAKSVRTGQLIDLKRKRRTRRHPPLVALCDISGSMAGYTRMLLYFLHAVTTDRDRVHSFLFGTELTNVTRHLEHRDPDEALARIARTVSDWSGGTRIADSLETFNRTWSRRVLGQGAVVLLITDGLDRAGGEGIGEQMDRLRRSCRKLIWLNPLLRYDQFEAKSQGVKAMIPYVDDFRPVHSIASLADLATAFDTLDTAHRPLVRTAA